MVRTYEVMTESIVLVHFLSSIDAGDDEAIFNLFESKRDHPSKFVILIDVPGGEFETCLTIYKTLQSQSEKHRIIGVAERAASGGFLVLQGCSTRIGTENSQIVIHPIFIRRSVPSLKLKLAESLQKAFQYKEDVEKTSEVFLNLTSESLAFNFQIELENIIREKTKLTDSAIESIMNSGTATKYSVQDAMQFGLIDEISG